MNERNELNLLERLDFVINNDFKKITYTEAFEILRNSKPNKKKKNSLILQAVSEGGYSTLKDNDIQIAKNISDIIKLSAPSKLTNIELEKIMANKQVDFSIDISRFAENINASCNTKDIETMFELLYASITEPK